MNPTLRILSGIVVCLIAACTLPPDGRAAQDVRLIWTDMSTDDNPALNTKVYEQSAAGIALPDLPALWKQIAAPSCTPDTDPAAPGKQNTVTLPAVASGTHTYVVVATNGGGDSGPSNTATKTVVAGPPRPHTNLIITIVVP